MFDVLIIVLFSLWQRYREILITCLTIGCCLFILSSSRTSQYCQDGQVGGIAAVDRLAARRGSAAVEGGRT